MRKLTILLAAIAALGVLGISAASAGATVLKPAGGAFTAKAGVTKFISNNGAGGVVECQKSEATGTSPAAPNNALANGSVTTNLGSLSFTTCLALGNPAVVESTNMYSLSALTTPANEHVVGITIPGAGVRINVAGGVCEILVANQTGTGPIAQSVLGLFVNNGAGGGTLSVKGQLSFTETCGAGLASPGVFFAKTGEQGTSSYAVTGLEIE